MRSKNVEISPFLGLVQNRGFSGNMTDGERALTGKVRRPARQTTLSGTNAAHVHVGLRAQRVPPFDTCLDSFSTPKLALIGLLGPRCWPARMPPVTVPTLPVERAHPRMALFSQKFETEVVRLLRHTPIRNPEPFTKPYFGRIL